MVTIFWVGCGGGSAGDMTKGRGGALPDDSASFGGEVVGENNTAGDDVVDGLTDEISAVADVPEQLREPVIRGVAGPRGYSGGDSGQTDGVFDEWLGNTCPCNPSRFALRWEQDREGLPSHLAVSYSIRIVTVADDREVCSLARFGSRKIETQEFPLSVCKLESGVTYRGEIAASHSDYVSSSTASFTFTTDFQPPALTLSEQPRHITSSRAASFKFVAADDGGSGLDESYVRCVLDEEAQPCDWNGFHVGAGSLEEGTHRVLIEVKDRANNRARALLTWEVVRESIRVLSQVNSDHAHFSRSEDPLGSITITASEPGRIARYSLEGATELEAAVDVPKYAGWVPFDNLGDADGDEVLDYVAKTGKDGEFSVVSGKTFRTLRSFTVAGMGGILRSVPDLDGDGLEDVAVSGSEKISLVSSLNGSVIREIQTKSISCFDVVDDVDDDGKSDYVVCQKWHLRRGSGSIIHLQSPSQGRLYSGTSPDPLWETGFGSRVSSVVGQTYLPRVLRAGTVGDINGDGKADVFFELVEKTEIRSGPNGAILHSSEFPEDSLGRTIKGVGRLLSLDFNGDGVIDLAYQVTTTALQGEMGIEIVSTDDARSVFSFRTSTTGSAGVKILDVEDINSDGKDDLLVRLLTSTDEKPRLGHQVLVFEGRKEQAE